jgi:tetratricopeptide (TPR) repeat protein
MYCVSRNVLAVMLLLCSASLPAQIASLPQDNRENSSPAVAPPSPLSSAQELETRGDVLRAEKDYLDAIDFYATALKKNNTATLHNKMGVAFLQLAKYTEARREFQRAIKLDKSLPEPHNNLGVTYYERKQNDDAVKEYQRALKLRPQSAPFHSNLGSAYFSLKEFEKAAKEYARAMQIDPNIFDPSPSGGVSVKLANAGDRAYLHYVIARMYAGKGDVERCRLYLSKANEEGYPRIKDALKDEQFGDLRKDPAFVAFVLSLKPLPPLEATN